MLEQYATVVAADRGAKGGMEALLRAERDDAFTKSHGPRLRMLISFALTTRASGVGDLRGHRAAVHLTTGLAEELDHQRPENAVLAEAQAMSAVMEALRLGSQGDLSGMRGATGRAVALSDQLSPSRSKDQVLGQMTVRRQWGRRAGS
ncbi:hypothetical protein ACPFP2_25960 [Micromonospora citrea]|uniref:hypothetical protein n=1 Tax=Micromonospora citrea TaxID=47855 RepID=UPI003C50F337